jgi:hypothetical protein
VILFLAVALAHGDLSWATTAPTLNPLDSVGELEVDVFVGESVGSAHEPWLFEGEADRHDEFVTSLTSEIESVLRASGFRLAKGAEDRVFVSLWGHRDTTVAEQAINVLLIEISLVDANYAPEAQCEEKRDLVQDLRRIGVAKRDNLEEFLRAESLAALQEWLPTGPARAEELSQQEPANPTK